MTELLGQRADWMWNFNPDQLANINKMPHLQAVQQESMRIGYLSIDAAGRSGKDNPLTNQKVRQAIWHAINRQDMADKLVQGGSRVPVAPCFPTPVRLRRRRRGEVSLRSGQGQGAARRGGLPQRLR